jgi:hypothetical protein
MFSALPGSEEKKLPTVTEYLCGVMAEVDIFKKFDFLFSVDM